ncbi:hypothetical protein DM01DRAFT_1331593 [Hesseltinella vesiculosa]|uniref:HSF-type DNA-binding domain-containing protein n=1 Tax=Hesseltinella vesiculosa TaxID=101127 RepID=A0A1X2GVS7_9FUNG|nr:hypothetical protein DM01DRAFT_1331593 [Hesseltinella vesiculosa]
MVGDIQYQHLIAWTYSGTSFIVCNITEFSRDVLPKHFKHNNFSSFVRQLNMYGFHKVNKSPRGHRTLAENQIWEFSHNKFLRGRPELLDEIKRKALETDLSRRDLNGADINSQVTMMQMAQSEMRQQLLQLQSSMTRLTNDFELTKKQQAAQNEMMHNLLQFMSQHLGVPLPASLSVDTNDTSKARNSMEQPPPIFVTSHDISPKAEPFYGSQHQPGYHSPTSPSPPRLADLNAPSPSYQQQHSHHQLSLTVQTNNLHHISPSSPSSPVQPSSPASYHAAVNTPLPPSPSPGSFFSEDDPALYSNPHSPNTSQFMLDPSFPQDQNVHRMSLQDAHIHPSSLLPFQ